MKTAVIALHFGEPRKATLEEVVPFLERIFLANANLEDLPDQAARERRSRELAERRAPSLIEEYEEIGGSPLNEQADAQGRALGLELLRRGHQVHVYSAFQFTHPLIPDVVKQARADGVERIVGLPVYPLCGPSTNVAALDGIQRALDDLEWTVEFGGVTGWHRHPAYIELRADAVRRLAEERGLDLRAPRTHLVFSAHGTPQKYLDEGSRYVEYVEEFCEEVARILGVDDYLLGYQNHSNRGIPWTQPDVEAVIRDVDGGAVLVEPVSFMHEQSETLAELDHELREEAEEVGLDFHRVPVPHDDPRFAGILADVLEPLLTGQDSTLGLQLAPCRCRPKAGTVCLNALPRERAAPAPEPVAGT